MTNKLIKETVFHTVSLGKLEVVINEDQLKFLCLYLAYFINHYVGWPFYLETIDGRAIMFLPEGRDVRIYRCATAPELIVSCVLTEDELKELCVQLSDHSFESRHTYPVPSYKGFNNNHYTESGGYVVKEKDGVIYTDAPTDRLTLVIDINKDAIQKVIQ
jgi:hypothetical protein